MFTSAGGKQRIPFISKSLSALGVPVRVIVDFDALNDANILGALVASVGLTYAAEWERDRRVVDSNIRGSEALLKVAVLREAINEILVGDSDTLVTRQMLIKIRETIQASTGWRAAKQRGRGAVPSGDATAALGRLLSRLQAAGIYVVPDGQVESMVKVIGGHGTEWLAEVIEQDLIAAAADAHAFVDSIIKSLRTLDLPL